MKYLAIMAILICSSVSLAVPRSRSMQPATVPLWTQPETWQKLEKKMTIQQVTRILGKPASQRAVAAGMIWFYEEGNITDSCVKFRDSNSTYTVYTWTEPNFDVMQAAEKAKQEALALEVERLAAEFEKKKAVIEKKRLQIEQRQAQIEKDQLARKLQVEQRRQRIAERTKEKLAKETEEPKNPFDEPIGSTGVTAKVFIYAGGGFLALALLFVCFCRKTWH